MDQVLPLGSFLKWVPFMMQVPMVPGWVATGLGLSFNHMEFTEKPMGKAQILDDASVSVHAFTLSAQIFPSLSNIAGEHSLCQPNYSWKFVLLFPLLIVLAHSVICFLQVLWNKYVENLASYVCPHYKLSHIFSCAISRLFSLFL
jgi:hypothetical protein